MIELISTCVPLAVPTPIMAAIVQVESGGNPYAIGVVNGSLNRQPRSLEEAKAVANQLHQQGYNYSIGAAQINKVNFKPYNISPESSGFDWCSNIKAGAKILAQCYSRSNNDWSKAFSCYYSGNFITGFQHGYVTKVIRAYTDFNQNKNDINNMNGMDYNNQQSTAFFNKKPSNIAILGQNIRRTTNLFVPNTDKIHDINVKNTLISGYDNKNGQSIDLNSKLIKTNTVNQSEVTDNVINEELKRDSAFVF